MTPEHKEVAHEESLDGRGDCPCIGSDGPRTIRHAHEVNGAAESKLTGKWQGKTESGRQVVLDARVDGQDLTGRFTLAEQSAEITEGKVEGTTFSFTAGPLEQSHSRGDASVTKSN